MDWLDRAIKEREELKERIDKLRSYRESDKFKALYIDDIVDLMDQLRIMEDYYAVLDRRISRHSRDQEVCHEC